MNSRHCPLIRSAFGFAEVALFSTLLASTAEAAVPPGYTGTPFGGTARAVPGRIDFEDFDEGGQGVGWDVDDHTGNFGENGCAGNAHRDDAIHPQLCQTNGPGETDTYTEGPMTGMLYPSPEEPQSIYLGYAHADDWVNVTIDVREAGTYALSSTWASEAGGPGEIGFEVSINDVVQATVSLPGTGGYHNWVVYDDFARIELEAGLQVLKFRLTTFHLNYDYLQLSFVNPDGSLDDGSGDGTGGMDGAGGAATGGAGVGGMDVGTGAMTTGGADVGTPGVGGTIAATGGTPAVGGTMSDVTDGTMSAPGEEAGCSCAVPGNVSPASGSMAGMALFGLAFLRRRRRPAT